jgi:hypothetical protein
VLGIEREITVNSGSMQNPIGVGFGHWEGLEVLAIDLQADPGEISHAEMFAPEEVIWIAIDSSQPDPWTFETAAIFPDDAFAVVFRGSITSPTPGAGEWAVAVSTVDLDCDSLNQYQGDYRTPAADDPVADQAEYAGSHDFDGNVVGMNMAPSESWAMLTLRADIRRQGVLRLNADEFGVDEFDFADAGFTPLTVIGADGAKRILFEATVNPGDGPWTFYFKPKSGANDDSQVTIQAVLAATGAAGSPSADDARATDQVFVVFQQEVLPDLISVEFIEETTLNLAGNPDMNRYGDLQKGTNPDGSTTEPANRTLYQLITPAYEGGHRFFPDAGQGDVNTGKNIVRVRATVTNMAVGDVVLFKPFDVDDPSDKPYPLNKLIIDNKGSAGDDNRGRLNGAAPPEIHRAGISKSSAQGGWRGRLRSVDEGEGGEVRGPWGEVGAAVSARVKEVQIGGNATLIAETDMLTTFAPGDNFRVAAVPERMEAALGSLHTKIISGNDATDRYRVPTSGPTSSGINKYFTDQLAVWRHLYIENDATANLYALMQPVTNRQNNRFADAFIEPNYTVFDQNNVKPTLPAGNTACEVVGGAVVPADVAVIDGERQSAGSESRQFWVVHVTDVFPNGVLNPPMPGLFAGVTFNNAVIPAASRYQSSNIFHTATVAAVGAVQGLVASQKVTVHEIAHQMLQPGIGGQSVDQHGHRGQAIDVVNYRNASAANKLAETWMNKLSIMNPDAIGVPMTTEVVDWFYFHPGEIDAMRRLAQP